MKRKITFLTSIFMVAMMLFTGSVFAAETFTYDGVTYVIDEVKLKLDSLSDDIECIGIYNDYYVIIDSIAEKIYKVNEKECILMTNQEVLDFMNSQYDILHSIEEDLNIYEEKMSYYAGMMELMVTEDEVVDSNKEYYKKVEVPEGGYEVVPAEDSDLANLASGEVLEYAYLVLPKSATIDENIAYYKQDRTTGIYTRVENPKEEEILEYKVIGNPDEYYSITKIGKITQEAYDKIIPTPEQNIMSFGFRLVEDKENNDMCLIAEYSYYSDSEKSIIYKLDGTVIKEYDERMTIMPIGNKFFAIAPIKDDGITDDSKMVIIDKEGNTVLENTEIPYLRTIGYDKYTTYLKHYEYDVNKFYNMYEYKLLSEDNQKYEGKELQVKTSGELNRLISVKVNGTELDASNYTKTSGSTIITLKNDYLKTLAIGTYTLELGYVDGTKIETKFVVDKLYSSDTESEGNTGTASGAGNAGSVEGTTGGGAGNTIEGDKDDTPKTGSNIEDSNVGLYITLTIAIIGVVATSRKRK